jgi:secreted trypsin-like serine protease
MVSVKHNGFHVCGGTLISNRHVLTAARCFNSLDAREFQVQVGSIRKSYEAIFIDVRRITQHRDFDKSLFRSDIAILELSEAVEYLQPATLVFSQDEPAEGSPMTILGWGSTYRFPPQYPETLQVTTVEISSQKSCQRAYSSTHAEGSITDEDFCSDAAGAMTTACSGDAGGPGIMDGNIVVGIISYDSGCSRPGHPTLYTRVNAYEGFIMEQLTGVNH